MNEVIASVAAGCMALGLGIFGTWLKMRNGKSNGQCAEHSGICERMADGERRFGVVETTLLDHGKTLGRIDNTVTRMDTTLQFMADKDN